MGQDGMSCWGRWHTQGMFLWELTPLPVPWQVLSLLSSCWTNKENPSAGFFGVLTLCSFLAAPYRGAFHAVPSVSHIQGKISLGILIRRQEMMSLVCREKVHSSSCSTTISTIWSLTDENCSVSSIGKLHFFFHGESRDLNCRDHSEGSVSFSGESGDLTNLQEVLRVTGAEFTQNFFGFPHCWFSREADYSILSFL